MKKLILAILFLLLFALASYFFGCHNPFVARAAHRRITTGMTASEVVDIVREYESMVEPHGHTSYHLRLIDEETKRTCDSLKDRWMQCIKEKKYRINCRIDIPEIEVCGYKRFDDKKFIETVNQVASGKVRYEEFQAYALFMIMGPVTTHNTFQIHFGNNGRVERVTDIIHAD